MLRAAWRTMGFGFGEARWGMQSAVNMTDAERPPRNWYADFWKPVCAPIERDVGSTSALGTMAYWVPVGRCLT